VGVMVSLCMLRRLLVRIGSGSSGGFFVGALCDLCFGGFYLLCG